MSVLKVVTNPSIQMRRKKNIIFKLNEKQTLKRIFLVLPLKLKEY